MRTVVTSQVTQQRLSDDAQISPTAPAAHLPTVWVSCEKQFQEIEGFGGAFTESAAVNWIGLSESKRNELIEQYFCDAQGHGYSFCRVHMNSCDFSLGNYAHAEQPHDSSLSSFSILRDEQRLIPMIKAAQAVMSRPLKLLASPWSPPGWMKTNGQMNQGGSLLPQYREIWSKCYVKFILAYQAHGIPIWGVSVQNEPAAIQSWDSCVYSAEEERDFVRDWLGPALEQAGLGHVKIVIWDHNRDLMVQRAATVLKDPEAAKYVWGTGFHWYGEDQFEHVQMLHDAWPDKKLLFTEGCQEGGSHRGSWSLGERYARSIINDLNRWTVGWIDWNLALSLDGGPNHVNNLCSAPVLVDTDNDRLEFQSSFYYLGHFSRYVKRGARRILCSATKARLECTAFINPSQQIVVIVMNRYDDPIDFQVKLEDSCYPVSLPPHSIATYLFDPT